MGAVIHTPDHGWKPENCPACRRHGVIMRGIRPEPTK